MRLPAPMSIDSAHLSVLDSQYDAFIFDVWGVIHDGLTCYPGVLNYLQHLQSLHKTILFLSNAPRPAAILVNKLLTLGIQASTDMALTSGDIVREKLSDFNDVIFKNLQPIAYHLGENRNKDILSGISNITVVHSLPEASFVLLTAYMDEGEDLNQYDAFLKKAIALHKPFICANPDKDIMNGEKTRYCSGVLAEKAVAFGGTVYYFGKPHSAIYEAAFKRLKTRGIEDKKRILMLGDTLETDILGANKAGIDSALLLTGHTHLMLAREQTTFSSEQQLQQHYEKNKVYPNWVIPHFN